MIDRYASKRTANGLSRRRSLDDLCDRADRGQRVQPGRQVEPQAQGVAQDVLDVAEERVERRQQDAQGQREQELDGGDDRQQEQPDASSGRGRTGRRSPRAISPKAKLTVPAMTDAVGRTIFGNWIWRMSCCRPVTDRVASLSVVENHFQGRMAAKMKSG